jgi:hypothetical protein
MLAIGASRNGSKYHLAIDEFFVSPVRDLPLAALSIGGDYLGGKIDASQLWFRQINFYCADGVFGCPSCTIRGERENTLVARAFSHSLGGF